MSSHSKRILPLFSLVLLVLPLNRSAYPQEASQVSFSQKPGQLIISIRDKEFATYTVKDAKNTRPFFANVYAPGGIKVTRNYPPQKGDQKDHPHHQGIFFTFGDLHGIDFWRTKGRTVHKKFVHAPQGGAGKGTFTVANAYLSLDGKSTLCEEVCQYTIRVTDQGYRIELDTKLTASSGEVSFGSKEEGGMAARVATPLAVVNSGRMVDNHGRVNGKQIWGKEATWVDYSGPIKGQHVGLTILVHPDNPRPSWWHARDYGLLAANPFGPLNSKKGGLQLKKGESLRLRYAVVLHSHSQAKEYVPEEAYRNYVK